MEKMPRRSLSCVNVHSRTSPHLLSQLLICEQFSVSCIEKLGHRQQGVVSTVFTLQECDDFSRGFYLKLPCGQRNLPPGTKDYQRILSIITSFPVQERGAE